MQPLSLTLRGFRGIRDGLGLDVVTLDFERLADGAELIAIAGANGSGKTTIMDNLTPFLTLPSRETMAGSGGFSYYDHVCLPENEKDLTWAHELTFFHAGHGEKSLLRWRHVGGGPRLQRGDH
jgi:exonuclease SbcC